MWAVYVADRLFDARSSLRTGKTYRLRQRHHFHWQHRSILVSFAIATAATSVYIVFALMPISAREHNTILAAAALAYFTRVHSSARQISTRATPLRHLMPQGKFPFASKELAVALLFTAACVLPVFSRLPAGAHPWPLMVAAAFLTLLAWLNCHAIEYWECAVDPQVQGCFFGFARPFPSAILLGISALLSAIILSPSHPRSAALLAACAASALLLAVLDRMRSRLTPLAIRCLADLALLTPIALCVR
jgi:hypothetical protein